MARLIGCLIGVCALWAAVARGASPSGDEGASGPAISSPAGPQEELLGPAEAARPSSGATEAERTRVEDAFGRLPLYFVENRGQLDERVAYYVEGHDKTLYFTSEGVTFSLAGEGADARERWVVRLEFVGARAGVVPRGEERHQAVFSYFRGRPEEWNVGVPTYSKVVYEDLWPGIDLVFSGTVDRLKYAFVVAPGADPGQVRLAYVGAEHVGVTASGALEITTPVASFEDGTPSASQEVGGVEREVDVAYAPAESEEEGRFGFGFDLGAFDPSLPLVIDPEMLVYCGYIGGTHEDGGEGIAVDSAGAAYVTGLTYSSESEGFPVLVGPDLTFNGGYWDAFVAKVAPDGSGLLYCGYIGGTDDEFGYGIAVDSAGAAYVMGGTLSSESEGFPVLVGPDLTFNGTYDAFVAKVAPDGSALLYCGYIGGTDRDSGSDIAVDSAGAAYVTGTTWSSESEGFPVLVGPDLSFNGGIYYGDAFVAKVAPDGSRLPYCGYIGGTGGDYGKDIAVDSAGAAYVTGYTYSSESAGFPVVVGPDLTFNGGYGDADAFVAKVAPDGTGLLYCGYIGGMDGDEGWGIAVDWAGAAYVTGKTYSSESAGFPVLVGPDLSYNGGNEHGGDAFVAKVVPDGTRLRYCGYIGGRDWDGGRGIAVDSAGAAYVAGHTYSSESEGFPVLVGPDLSFNGYYDAFVAKVAPDGTRLLYCGYIGGTNNEYGYGIAVDSAGAAYVTGITYSGESNGFPVFVGPDLSFNGYYDAFVAKVPNLSVIPAGRPRRHR